MFAEPDRNRLASDYLQEDQRDSQTDLPLFLLLLTVSSRRMCKVARTGSKHQGALFGGFTLGVQRRSSTPLFLFSIQRDPHLIASDRDF